MNKQSLSLAALIAMIALPLPAGDAKADSLYVPLLTYRTGAFAGSGIPVANGMHDYLMMLNERDGGVGEKLTDLRSQSDARFGEQLPVVCLEDPADVPCHRPAIPVRWMRQRQCFPAAGEQSSRMLVPAR